MSDRSRRAYSSKGEPVDTGAFQAGRARRLLSRQAQKGAEQMAARKKTAAKPSGAAVEKPLSIDGDGSGEALPPFDGAGGGSDPVLIYGHSPDMAELKAVHNERESDPEWQASIATYQPIVAAKPDWSKVEVRESDVPDPEPGPESVPGHPEHYRDEPEAAPDAAPDAVAAEAAPD